MSAPEDPAPLNTYGGGCGTVVPIPQTATISPIRKPILKNTSIEFAKRLRDPSSIILPPTLKEIPLSKIQKIPDTITDLNTTIVNTITLSVSGRIGHVTLSGHILIETGVPGTYYLAVTRSSSGSHISITPNRIHQICSFYVGRYDDPLMLPSHIRTWMLLAQGLGAGDPDALDKHWGIGGVDIRGSFAYLLHFPIEESPVIPKIDDVMTNIMNEIISGECDSNDYFDDAYGLITEVPDTLDIFGVFRFDASDNPIPRDTIKLTDYQKEIFQGIMDVSPIIAIVVRRTMGIIIIKNTGQSIKFELPRSQPRPGVPVRFDHSDAGYTDQIVLPKMYIDLVKKSVHLGVDCGRYQAEKMKIYNAVTHFTPISAYAYLNIYPYDHIDT
jgi:hypothetical protein